MSTMADILENIQQSFLGSIHKPMLFMELAFIGLISLLFVPIACADYLWIVGVYFALTSVVDFLLFYGMDFREYEEQDGPMYIWERVAIVLLLISFSVFGLRLIWFLAPLCGLSLSVFVAHWLGDEHAAENMTIKEHFCDIWRWIYQEMENLVVGEEDRDDAQGDGVKLEDEARTDSHEESSVKASRTEEEEETDGNFDGEKDMVSMPDGLRQDRDLLSKELCNMESKHLKELDELEEVHKLELHYMQMLHDRDIGQLIAKHQAELKINLREWESERQTLLKTIAGLKSQTWDCNGMNSDCFWKKQVEKCMEVVVEDLGELHEEFSDGLRDYIQSMNQRNECSEQKLKTREEEVSRLIRLLEKSKDEQSALELKNDELAEKLSWTTSMCEYYRKCMNDLFTEVGQ